jgi:hypothetical protein
MDVDEDTDKTLVQSGEEEEDDKDEDDGNGNEEEEKDSGTGRDTDKEEEEDSDDNNNGSDIVVIPRKCKRSGSRKKSNGTQPIFLPLPDTVDLAQESKPCDIEYKFAIFSAKEMKKSKSSRM